MGWRTACPRTLESPQRTIQHKQSGLSRYQSSILQYYPILRRHYSRLDRCRSNSLIRHVGVSSLFLPSNKKWDYDRILQPLGTEGCSVLLAVMDFVRQLGTCKKCFVMESLQPNKLSQTVTIQPLMRNQSLI